ncbi:uncharacterized protein LAJ45_04713 [Morchella importuna]|uniref:uncharacterized protein n=1 Tax=Morchella importuna TaxID=1174673 RepID=UPI001E8E2FD3|nr:uncharacterized protein LAJ45_04713 [Morchella importuna]KAH8151012.1 hypothetical protein LAJ45_04713 [Morchella importuna]
MVASPVPENPEAHSEPLLVTPAHPTVDIEQGHATGMRHRQSRNSRIRRHGSGSPAMQALERLGRTMTNAHKKDYERKRGSEDDADGSSSDEEEEGEEEEGGLESADFYQRTAEGEAGELTLTKTVTEAGR